VNVNGALVGDHFENDPPIANAAAKQPPISPPHRRYVPGERIDFHRVQGAIYVRLIARGNGRERPLGAAT
jgi:hypothetical protein